MSELTILFVSNPTLRFIRESEGSFQYGNYRREADELRNVVEFFHAKKRLIAAVIGHSKGLFSF